MAKATDKSIHALALLTDARSVEPRPVCVLAGDDGFLRHEARTALAGRIAALKGGDGETDVDQVDGRTAELRDVLDALRERCLFGGGSRVVAVCDADPFVKQYREQLEDCVVRPVDDATLMLEVESWPGNTRLAKAVAAEGLTIRCQAPQSGRETGQFNRQLKDWLAAVAKREFGLQLAAAASDALLELLPSEPGILYQEVVKLALLGDGESIDATLVRKYVGGWRTQKTWDMIDAAADGNAAAALQQLDRLVAAGEEPHALLPQMSATLRRFNAAVVLFEQAERTGRRMSLRSALELAGTPKFKLGDAERQLRQIGRERAKHLFDWLLAADLGLKGYNSHKDRARRVIETLIVRLSRAAAPTASASR